MTTINLFDDSVKISEPVIGNSIARIRTYELALDIKKYLNQFHSIIGTRPYSIVSVNFSKDNLFISGQAEAYSTKIRGYGGIDFNILFLLKPDEIPEKFQVIDDEDSRLSIDLFLLEFVEWVKTHFGISFLTSIGMKEKMLIRTFLIKINNPDDFYAWKNFVIAHECAHLARNHFNKHTIDLDTTSLLKPAICLSIGASVGAISLRIFPWYVSILFGVVGGKITSLAHRALKDLSISREYEYDADLYAKKIVGERGGILRAKQTMKGYRQLLVNPEISWWNKLFLSFITAYDGDLRFPFYLFNTHPRDGDRIAALLAAD